MVEQVLHGESNGGQAPQKSAKDKMILQILNPKPHQVNAHIYVSRTQGRARTHPVTRRVTTQYLRTQSITTR